MLRPSRFKKADQSCYPLPSILSAISCANLPNNLFSNPSGYHLIFSIVHCSHPSYLSSLSSLGSHSAKMGSIGVTDTVSWPDNPKAWSCSNLPASTTRKPVTEQHISYLRELVNKSDDGSVLLVPGDDGYEESLRRWSRAAEKRAVSATLLSARCTQILVLSRLDPPESSSPGNPKLGGSCCSFNSRQLSCLTDPS